MPLLGQRFVLFYMFFPCNSIDERNHVLEKHEMRARADKCSKAHGMRACVIWAGKFQILNLMRGLQASDEGFL